MVDDQRYQPESNGLDSYTPEQQAQIVRLIASERGARPNQMDAVRNLVMANPQMADNIAQRFNIVPDSQYSGDPNNPGQLFGFLGPGANGNGDGPITPVKAKSRDEINMPSGHTNIVEKAKGKTKAKEPPAQSNPPTDLNNPGDPTMAVAGALGAAGVGAAGYAAYRAMRGRGGSNVNSAGPGGALSPDDPRMSAGPVMGEGDLHARRIGAPVNAMDEAIMRSLGGGADDIIDAEFTPANRVSGPADRAALQEAQQQRQIEGPRTALPAPTSPNEAAPASNTPRVIQGQPPQGIEPEALRQMLANGDVDFRQLQNTPINRMSGVTNPIDDEVNRSMAEAEEFKKKPAKERVKSAATKNASEQGKRNAKKAAAKGAKKALGTALKR